MFLSSLVINFYTPNVLTKPVKNTKPVQTRANSANVPFDSSQSEGFAKVTGTRTIKPNDKSTNNDVKP